MIDIRGYSLEHRLHRSRAHVVWRGHRAWDGLPVVAKALSSRFPGPEDISRLRREYDMLQRLDGSGAPRPIGFEVGEHGAAIIMADRGGRPLTHALRRGPMDLASFLTTALSITAALAQVHHAGLIHRDLGPSNVVIDGDGTARIIDFACAVELTSQSAAGEGAGALEGTLAYMAPEQTGRLNRGVDHRSDFYALGATFYELLTGRPPFVETDTLDLIHAHLGRPPEPPHVLNPRVPPVLSQIVLKLLAKAAEDRYQSLRGLQIDLETCRDTLTVAGAVPDFRIAASDLRDTFRLPQKLYGRQEQVESLVQAFARTCDGEAELVLISGPSGIGKTALVREVFRPVGGRRGAFIAGKFEEFRRNAPYAAVTEAFAQYLRRLLGGSEQDLAQVRARLETMLGDDAGVVSEVMPELEVLMGPQAPAPPLAAVETEQRFNRVFRAFVQAVVGPAHPLVLFLDDLHWADRSTLHLLQHLLLAGDLRHMLIIGTYREGDIEHGHPLSFMVERLRAGGQTVGHLGLGPLTPENVWALLADTLGCDVNAAAPLGDVCHEKTGGNPFFLQRFLLALYEDGLIAFDGRRGAWTWDLEAISGLDITDNVVDLMVGAIRRLSPVGQRVLTRAACIGGQFDLAALSRINDVGPAETLTQLWESLTEGLIVPVGEAYRHFRRAAPGSAPKPRGPDPKLPIAPQQARFRFLHDRVHQAAYTLIPAKERGLRHLNIGRMLLDSMGGEELADRLFDILDQLNRGRAHVVDLHLSERIARLNLEAARKAKASAAYASALAYAREGLGCLGPDAWSDQRPLALDLHNEAIEAAYMVGDRALLARTIDSVLSQARDSLEKARALEIKVLSHAAADETEAAVDAALDALEALGYGLPREPGPIANLIAFFRLDLMIKRAERAGRPVLPRATGRGRGRGRPNGDRRAEAALRILIAVSAPIYAARPDLVAVSCARVAELAFVHGAPAQIAFAYSLHGIVASAAGRTETGYRSAVTALGLLDTLPDAEVKPRARFGSLFMGLGWREPLRVLRDRFLDCARLARAVNEVETVAHSLFGQVLAGTLAGIELPILEADAASAAEALRRHNNSFCMPMMTAVAQMIDNLTSHRDLPAVLVGRHHDEHVATQALLENRNFLLLTHVGTLKVMLGVIYGEYAEARTAAALVAQHHDIVRGTIAGPAFEFYRALAYSRDPASGSVQRRLVKLRRSLSQFRRWAGFGPANMLHRRQLLEAEEARLTSQTLNAAELYDQAIKTAHDNGFLHDEALANEFAADFHDSRGRPMIAEAYRRQAHYRWRLWGASARAHVLEQRFPELAQDDTGDRPPMLGRERSPVGEGFDIAAVLKAAQAISGEIHRPALMENLLRITMGTAGAQRGLLILRGPEGWTVEAEGAAGSDSFTLHRARALIDGGTLPAGVAQRQADPPPFSRGIFNYVARTRDAVVLNNAPEEGAFTADPYVLQFRPRSVLCLPLVQQNELKGMLYLENNLTAGAFTSDRLEVLQLLTSQVVISLENALLYENLAELNRNLEREVGDRTREATEKSRLLEAILDNMSDGLVAYDAGGRMIVWNDRAVETFRVPMELRRRGTPQTAVVEAALASGTLSPRLAGMVVERITAGTPPFPDRPSSEIELSDGRFLQVRRRQMPDGGEVQVFLDVTEERARERELVAARQAAERALHDLQNAQESLIQAEKMASLGQLVAGIAHEINTPIGITLTAASFLSERAAEVQTLLRGAGLKRSQLDQFIDQSRETTALMMSNIQRAADLIHSFKQVAVDQTSGERRRFRLAAYIEEVMRSFGPMLRKTPHTVDISCPADLEVESVPGALSQILTNFVMNSLTHAFPDGRHGHLTIRAQELPDGDVELRYSDDGRGIPPEHQSRVFDPFFTTRRGTGGSGLGLNIVFNLVTSVLRGTIHLESQPDRGTCFVLRLPKRLPAAAPPEPEQAEPEQAQGAAE